MMTSLQCRIATVKDRRTTMATTQRKVTLAVDDRIASITIDDGKVNAMSIELMAEIDRALDVAENEGTVTVLAGRDGIFSAGFDLATFERGAEETRRMVVAGARLVERLLAFPRPVIAACAGHAYPMGAFLMLASDVRFGVRGPFRIGLNEVAIGLTVPRFAIELARHRLTPPGFARITTAALFDPDEAATLGYLDRVVTSDALRDEVRREAGRLLALDGPSYVATKARVNEGVVVAVRGAIDSELAA
jgi:enoyl-CoA hydratase